MFYQVLKKSSDSVINDLCYWPIQICFWAGYGHFKFSNIAEYHELSENVSPKVILNLLLYFLKGLTMNFKAWEVKVDRYFWKPNFYFFLGYLLPCRVNRLIEVSIQFYSIVASCSEDQVCRYIPRLLCLLIYLRLNLLLQLRAL